MSHVKFAMSSSDDIILSPCHTDMSHNLFPRPFLIFLLLKLLGSRCTNIMLTSHYPCGLIKECHVSPEINVLGHPKTFKIPSTCHGSRLPCHNHVDVICGSGITNVISPCHLPPIYVIPIN